MDLSRRLRISFTLPVLMKEMRSRMRGLRAPVLLFITTALTVVVALLIIVPMWDQTEWSAASSSQYGTMHTMADIGGVLFASLITLLGIIGALIAPALTAGSISIEKEQQTLEMLLLTRLSCANIVLGKYFSSLGFLLIVLLCAMPVLAIAFILGGVDPAQMFWSLLTILTTVSLFGGLAIYCSARFTRTATAVAAAYAYCVIWLTAIPLFVWMFSAAYDSSVHPLWKNLPYMVYAFAGGSVLALIPMATLATILGAIIHRQLSRMAHVGLWFLSAAGIIYPLLAFPGKIENLISNQVFLCFLGNPVVAMTFRFLPGARSHWLARYFVPITIAITIVATWILIIAAVNEVKKLRDHPTARRTHWGRRNDRGDAGTPPRSEPQEVTVNG